MTQTVDTSADSDRAAEIRNALTDKLRSDGMITSSVVERAFRTVPRHLLAAERKSWFPFGVVRGGSL